MMTDSLHDLAWSLLGRMVEMPVHIPAIKGLKASGPQALDDSFDTIHEVLFNVMLGRTFICSVHLTALGLDVTWKLGWCLEMLTPSQLLSLMHHVLFTFRVTCICCIFFRRLCFVELILLLCRLISLFN